jgi:hypothetical protein
VRERKKKLIKYKKYIILFLCILFVITAISAYLNYLKTFKARVNIIIYVTENEMQFKSFTNSPNFFEKIEYLNHIASNNISYFTQNLVGANFTQNLVGANFTQNLVGAKNFKTLTLKFKKKLNNSNTIDMENPGNFLKNSYMMSELHLTGFYHKSQRFFTEWTDTRTISIDNIKNEIQKIYLETRNEIYLEEEEIIKKKYFAINNSVNTFCEEKTRIIEKEIKNIYYVIDLIQKLKINDPNLEQKNITEKIKLIDKIIDERCLSAISNIEKESFFENVMIQNLKLAKETPDFRITTIIEKHPKKTKIQLLYESFLLSLIIFLNFLILRNLIFKLIK